MKTFKQFVTEGNKQIPLRSVDQLKGKSFSIVDTADGTEKDFKGGQLGINNHSGKIMLQILDKGRQIKYEFTVGENEDDSIKDIRKLDGNGYEFILNSGDVWRVR